MFASCFLENFYMDFVICIFGDALELEVGVYCVVGGSFAFASGCQ